MWSIHEIATEQIICIDLYNKMNIILRHLFSVFHYIFITFSILSTVSVLSVLCVCLFIFPYKNVHRLDLMLPKSLLFNNRICITASGLICSCFFTVVRHLPVHRNIQIPVLQLHSQFQFHSFRLS